MVIDTSALLAVIFNEKKGPRIAEILEQHSHELCMSTVNLTETLILMEDKQPKLFQEMREELLSSTIRFVPPTITQAETAARARMQYPINLGDCFAYALASEEQDSILTLDAEFKKTDAQIYPF